jgi:RHS repeat-associated protein
MSFAYDCQVKHAPLTHKFTGKERDSESGLDNFGLRYMGSNLGRFMSPDSIANDWELRNPQTWNRYAYARNNPLIYVDPDGAAVELICSGGNADQCKAQREAELKALQNAVGNKDAASRLYINEVKDGDNTRYFVGIKGDVGDFMKLGDSAHDLANIVQDKQVVEFGLTKNDLSQWGGAVTYAAGEAPGGSNQNVRVLVNTEQAVDLASTILERTVLGAGRMGGQNENPPWRIRDMTLGIAVWHELGHGWGYIHGRVGSRSNQEAVDWENRMRQQVYGPIGPNNAHRVRD